MTSAALLDVDGTLVDTNYQHAIAWQRAFAEAGLEIPAWRCHRAIGMGGDQLVAHVAGDRVEQQHGDEIRDGESRAYAELIDGVRTLPGARELIAAAAEHFDRVVLSSSAPADDIERYLDLLDARELADAWTTSADVEQTKPAPDLVAVALEAVGAEASASLMVGDTPYDCEAAQRAGVDCVAVLTGGFPAADLREAGALRLFESLEELRSALGELAHRPV